MRFPNYSFRLLRVNPELKKVEYEVPKSLTKVEIKNYLRSVYQMDVEKVHTAIRAGERHRVRMRPQMWERDRDIKKAIVTLKGPVPKLPTLD